MSASKTTDKNLKRENYAKNVASTIFGYTDY